MNIKQIIYGIAGLPNRIYNTLIMKYRRVKHGKNFRINGRICLQKAKGRYVLGTVVVSPTQHYLLVTL